MNRQKQLTLCGIKPRAWTELVEHPDGFRIRFYYPCGHQVVVDPQTDPKLSKVAPVLLRRFASSYWSKANGGCTDECPACRAVERRAARAGKATS